MTAKTDKIAWWLFWLTIIIMVCFIGLLGWGFIELIQWITSK